MLSKKLLVGTAVYDERRRIKKFAVGLRDRFYEDGSLERDEARRIRKIRDAAAAKEKSEAMKRKLRVDMAEIRRLQDELARKQGQHLEAEQTLMGAMMLQCAWRGRGARVKLNSLQELRALGLIGKYVMKYLNKKRQGRAACIFQNNARRWKAKRDRVSALVNRNAATVVQRAWRVFKSKATMAHCKLLHDTAVTFFHNVCIFAKARLFQRIVLPSVAAGLIQQRWRRFQRRKLALQLRLRHHREAAAAASVNTTRITAGHVAHLSTVWDRRRQSLQARQLLSTSPSLSSKQLKAKKAANITTKLSQRAALHALTQVRRASKAHVARQQQQHNLSVLVRAAALAQNQNIEEEKLVEGDDEPELTTTDEKHQTPSTIQKLSPSSSSATTTTTTTNVKQESKKATITSTPSTAPRRRRHHHRSKQASSTVKEPTKLRAERPSPSQSPTHKEAATAVKTPPKKLGSGPVGANSPAVQPRSNRTSATIATASRPTEGASEIKGAPSEGTEPASTVEIAQEKTDIFPSFQEVEEESRGSASMRSASSSSSGEKSGIDSDSYSDDYSSVSSSSSDDDSSSPGGSFVAVGMFSSFDQSDMYKLEEERQKQLSESRRENATRKKPSPPSTGRSRRREQSSSSVRRRRVK